MIRGRTRTTRGLVAVAAIGIVVALGGCASSRAADAEPSASPPATATDEVVTVPMPDLGPSPAPDPLTPEITEAARLADLDSGWQGVVAQYPNAMRPPVAFIGYVTQEERIPLVRACYESAGVAIDEGRASSDPSAPVIAIGASPVNEQQAIAVYVCNATYPLERTWSPPNAAQLGYIYDYLTEFLVPCYEANGIVNAEPPSREEFVALWPNQGWFPTAFPDGKPLEPGIESAIDDACPPPR